MEGIWQAASSIQLEPDDDDEVEEAGNTDSDGRCDV